MSNLEGPWRGLAFAILIAALASVVTYVVLVIQTGVIERAGIASPATAAISAEADGWTYDIPLDVPWTDAEGGSHDGGRPACLGPDAGNVPIHFYSVDVKANGEMWRQVVWVDCRTAASE